MRADQSGTRLLIHDVSARDGFQMESRFIPTTEKVAYIDQLSATGLAKIEVTSFTSPSAIPALSDAESVLKSIRRQHGVEYSALVPNVRGCQRALAVEVDEINWVMSVSEAHNYANLRMTCEQSLSQLKEVISCVSNSAAICASVSTAFGCPFEGEISESRLFEIVDRISKSGIDRMTICDTTGVANPAAVHRVFDRLGSRWPMVQFTAHFHNTRGMGLANVLAALEAGVIRFDASLGGLGGCPFAPGATGNVCTEDLVHMAQEMGYETGVDLSLLLDIAGQLHTIVGHEVPGQVLKAGPSSRRYPLPKVNSPQRPARDCATGVP